MPDQKQNLQELAKSAAEDVSGVVNNAAIEYFHECAKRITEQPWIGYACRKKAKHKGKCEV